MRNWKRWLGPVCATLLAASVVTPVVSQRAVAEEMSQDVVAVMPMSESGVQFDRISLEIGATEASRNFNWISTSTQAGYAQVALMPEGWKDGSAKRARGRLELLQGNRKRPHRQHLLYLSCGQRRGLVRRLRL